MSRVVVLAGPNGAGKSTCAAAILHGPFKVDEFVNADVIAQGLSGFAPQRVAFDAGRILLTRIRELAKQQKNFAFETTLASRTFAPWLKILRKQGYEICLVFIRLSSPELAISRVRERVRRGGHFVGDDDVRRRYRRGLHNFFNLYLPLADRWQLVDNSQREEPSLVAIGERENTHILDSQAWLEVCRSMPS